MIVTCNKDHWKYMESLKPEGAPCGRTFDDAERSTICPHETLGFPNGLVCKQTDLYVSVCPCPQHNGKKSA